MVARVTIFRGEVKENEMHIVEAKLTALLAYCTINGNRQGA